MEIVIKISEEDYELMKYTTVKSGAKRDGDYMRSLILNGTPLPKGHGRLIDADETLKAMDTWDKFGYTETGCFVRNPKNDYVPYVHYEDMVNCVSDAPTIIKAESEDEND